MKKLNSDEGISMNINWKTAKEFGGPQKLRVNQLVF